MIVRLSYDGASVGFGPARSDILDQNCHGGGFGEAFFAKVAASCWLACTMVGGEMGSEVEVSLRGGG